MATNSDEQLAPLPTFSQPDSDQVVQPGAGSGEQAPPSGSPPSENPIGAENGSGKLPGSGEIDPPTDADEMSFVLDAMEQLDAPALETQPNQPAVAPVVQPVVAQPTNQQVVIPPVPGAQPQAQPAAAPQQPQAQPVVQPVVQPTQQSQSAAPGQEMEVLRQKMEQQRDKFIEVAAQSYESTFSDTDIDEIQTEPKKAFSKMAARLHADVVQNVLTMMTAQLPQMILGLSEAQHQQRAYKDAFWRANPDLQAHADKIIPMAQALRQANPTLPAEEFQKQLAGWARTALGVTPAVQQQQQQQAPRRPAAFQPAPTARPNGGAVQPVASDNPWEKIDQIMDADNRGVMDR